MCESDRRRVGTETDKSSDRSEECLKEIFCGRAGFCSPRRPGSGDRTSDFPNRVSRDCSEVRQWTQRRESAYQANTYVRGERHGLFLLNSTSGLMVNGGMLHGHETESKRDRWQEKAEERRLVLYVSNWFEQYLARYIWHEPLLLITKRNNSHPERKLKMFRSHISHRSCSFSIPEVM